jgi:hypothetical protein
VILTNDPAKEPISTLNTTDPEILVPSVKVIAKIIRISISCHWITCFDSYISGEYLLRLPNPSSSIAGS